MLLIGPLTVLAGCLAGPYPAPWSAVLGILAGGREYDPAWVMVVHMRLYRSVLAWLVGAGLAMSGVAFQGVLRNPLAEPFTLGVSGGAAFGAALAMGLGYTGATFIPGLSMVPVWALAGALAALGAALVLARGAGGTSRETLVLAGIVVSAFLSACISLFKALNEESVTSVVFWIMGGFQGCGAADVWLYLPYFGLGTLVVWFYSRELDVLALGQAQAVQLGVDAGRVRVRILAAASVMAGAAVSVCGVIGFVGLAAPHLARLGFGGGARRQLAVSGMLGGTLLVWSDIVARTILPGGAELPVGVVTALLGGPFFLFLLRKKAGGGA
jgi:iron complex transport system permease protein